MVLTSEELHRGDEFVRFELDIRVQGASGFLASAFWYLGGDQTVHPRTVPASEVQGVEVSIWGA